MAKYISLEFSEDLHRDDLPSYRDVKGCTGISTYRNTLNMYFERIDRSTLLSLSRALQRQLVLTGNGLAMQVGLLDSTATTQDIYQALRSELAS